MLHHIIVKFNDDITPERKKEIAAQAAALFEGLKQMPGIHDVALHTSCIDRPNRYDLMIEISMEKDALPSYDDCEIHHKWKTDFGAFIRSKAIFDCE